MSWALPVKSITSAHILGVLNNAAKKNGLTVAADAKRTMSSVFELAVSTLRVDADCDRPERHRSIAAPKAFTWPGHQDQPRLAILDGGDAGTELLISLEEWHFMAPIMAADFRRTGVVSRNRRNFRLPKPSGHERVEVVHRNQAEPAWLNAMDVRTLHAVRVHWLAR